MKKILFLIPYSLLLIDSCFGQGGTWTWISGTNVVSSAGAFGVQGVPSVSNYPPAYYEAAEWKDKSGNFWLYGGEYLGSFYSDLWRYNPATKEWTWMKGNGSMSQQPVYGTQGVPNAANTPGVRPLAAATWVDTSGAFWMFGGQGCSNDLWKYDSGTNEWTWMKGNTANARGVHGTQGTPNVANTPGGRCESSSAWTDSLNNLWLYGGNGYDDNNNLGLLNDLCKYNIATNEWTWVKGSALVGAAANYGTKGIANATNDPGGRFTYTKWKDAKGNFWIMGGGLNYGNSFNDTWKYDVTANEWTWMSGTSLAEDAGAYKTKCAFDSANVPYSRAENRSAVTDNCGRFWLLNGANFNGTYYFLNDIWIFDPQQSKWNWVSGTNVLNQTGSYGILGVPSPSNIPPPRMGAVAWWGTDNKIYMFGGYGSYNYYADLWMFDPDTNCVSSPCNSVVVLPPVANFQASKTNLCANDCINFTDLSTNATAWQWHFEGAADSTSIAQNPQNVCYLTAGTYKVTLVASNSGGRDTVTFSNYIKVSPAPPAPLITHLHDTLYCSIDPSYTSYQWYADTTLLIGATDTFLVITHGGNYNVKVTNESGCTTSSGIILSLQNYSNDNFISLSPNPAMDKLFVSGYSLSGKAMLKIYNALGEVCQQSEITNPKSEIDISSLTSAIYFVQLVGEKERWVGRFVKTEAR